MIPFDNAAVWIKHFDDRPGAHLHRLWAGYRFVIAELSFLLFDHAQDFGQRPALEFGTQAVRRGLVSCFTKAFECGFKQIGPANIMHILLLNAADEFEKLIGESNRIAIIGWRLDPWAILRAKTGGQDKP